MSELNRKHQRSNFNGLGANC